MLSCVMAAAMSSGDAVQVTLGGLFSQNIYRPFFKPEAPERHMVRVTRMAGVVVAIVAVGAAILMRSSVVKTILDYLNILSLVGISVAMGLVWRRMNTGGVFCSVGLAVAVFIVIRYVLGWSREAIAGLPLVAGLLGGIAGSYLSAPPEAKQIEEFFKRIYVPIGRESRLDAPLNETAPPEHRLLTWGGLFLLKPSRESWVGFLITLGICLLAVFFMYYLLRI